MYCNIWRGKIHTLTYICMLLLMNSAYFESSRNFSSSLFESFILDYVEFFFSILKSITSSSICSPGHIISCSSHVSQDASTKQEPLFANMKILNVNF